MVYGQTSRFVAAGGLLVTISKKLTLHPYSKIQLNPKSKRQLEILTRKLVCLVSSRSHVIDCKITNSYRPELVWVSCNYPLNGPIIGPKGKVPPYFQG